MAYRKFKSHRELAKRYAKVLGLKVCRETSCVWPDLEFYTLRTPSGIYLGGLDFKKVEGGLYDGWYVANRPQFMIEKDWNLVNEVVRYGKIRCPRFDKFY